MVQATVHAQLVVASNCSSCCAVYPPHEAAVSPALVGQHKGKESNVSDYYSTPIAEMPLFAAASRKIDLPISCAASADLVLRAGTQRWNLLRQYVLHGPLTNEQAGDLSGLSSKKSCCYWKRCSELLKHGYLENAHYSKVSQAGERQRVCRATQKGIDAINLGA